MAGDTQQPREAVALLHSVRTAARRFAASGSPSGDHFGDSECEKNEKR